jgi:hypothetical protein
VRRPTKKAILFFGLALGTGFTVSWIVMTFILGAPLRLYGFVNLFMVALLIAFLLVIWLDRPFELKLFQWPEPQPPPEHEEQEQAPVPQAETTEPEFVQSVPVAKDSMFPHELPSEHWGVDFGDSKQTYEGMALPIWLLAGWAAFIIWAVVYLVSGLPGAFR